MEVDPELTQLEQLHQLGNQRHRNEGQQTNENDSATHGGVNEDRGA